MGLRLLGSAMLGTLAFAQIDASALRGKYGPPLNRETFAVRPGIELIVDYGPNFQVCRMRLPGSAPKAQTDQVLAELIPIAMRGKEILHLSSSTGLGGMEYVEYEAVVITEMYAGNERQTLTVAFKSAGCAKPDRP